MTEHTKLIRELRIKSGWSQNEMAKLLGMSDMSYFDIELHEDELCSVPSLRQVQTMCGILGISIIELFIEPKSPNTLPPISFQELMSEVKNYIVSQGITTEEFAEFRGHHT